MAFPVTDGLFYVSRIQFALTAIFHFLFVPLTLGLSWILVVMEACYLKTNNIVYKDMTRFFGKLFAINFAMGVVTGITLEFEFGQNWAYFSRFSGDAFGQVLAVEGITAFMLEATMIGVFLFGWNKLSKGAHWIVTVLLAIGTNLSIVNILSANSWMQHPIATTFNPLTMHVHILSLGALYLSDVAQIRTCHVACAGFITGAVFVLGISSYYLLKGRDIDFAKRSFAIAAGFGLMAVILVGFWGDQNGLAIAKYEPAKMAAVEGQWETQKAPAAWYMIAFPDNKQEKDHLVVKIPYLLSLIATHSLSGTVEGMKPIIQRNADKIKKGILAYQALETLRGKKPTPEAQAMFDKYRPYLGWGFLLKRYSPDITKATPADISKAAKDSVPESWIVFWAFRFMVGFWVLMLIGMIIAYVIGLRGTAQNHRWLLRCFLYGIPIPWLAAEAGWVTAEVGRQPWTIHGMLPTYMSVSSVSTATVAFSLGGFALFYLSLFFVEIFLMIKYARLGPSTLGEKRYHFERSHRYA